MELSATACGFRVEPFIAPGVAEAATICVTRVIRKATLPLSRQLVGHLASLIAVVIKVLLILLTSQLEGVSVRPGHVSQVLIAIAERIVIILAKRVVLATPLINTLLKLVFVRVAH